MSKSLAYYTSDYLAHFLVSLIPLKKVNNVLDLCVGSGNLLWAARSKWPNSFLVGVDIDNKAVLSCRNRFKQHANFFKADARLMHPNILENTSKLNNRAFDVVLANPPFAGNKQNLLSIANECSLSNELKKTLPLNWKSLLQRTEAILLVYSLLYVRPGGYLAVIVPDSILSCDRFTFLRKWIVNQSQKLVIVKLPRNSFSCTEVDSSIIITKRTELSALCISPKFLLQEAKYSEKKIHRRTIYNGQLDNSFNRLDSMAMPSFYSASNINKLSDFTSYIKRGTFIAKEKIDIKGPHLYIHSTNIKNSGLDTDTNPKFITREITESEVLTKHGDILLVRVGRTLGKVGIVSRHEQIGYISSCLFIIRSENIDPFSLALLLKSRIAKTYYSKIARGSAAKFLTYADVQGIPVNFVDGDFITYIGNRHREIISSDMIGSDKEYYIRMLVKELDEVQDINECQS